MPPEILIIEDEASIADTIVYALKTEGFAATWAKLGSEGLAHLETALPALVILDVGLPDIGGFEVCKEIRRRSEVPILFLTARSEEIDRVVGLEIGGDDYVTKPFSPRELVARVKVILRRSGAGAGGAEPGSVDDDGLFTVDEPRARIEYRGRVLTLTRYEFLILKTLLSQPGRVFSREQLMDSAWSSPEASLDRAVDTHIKAIRAKLRQVDPDRDPVITHRGLGYSIVQRFDED